MVVLKINVVFFGFGWGRIGVSLEIFSFKIIV